MDSRRTGSHDAQLVEHKITRCEQCGAAFHCGVNDEDACWCATTYPSVVSGRSGSTCLCPRCLKNLIERENLT